MTATTFRVYTRGPDGQRSGEANELTTFTLTDRHNGVGGWELRVPYSHPARALLWQAGAGIELERTTTAADGTRTSTVVASGPVRTAARDYSAQGDAAIFYGATDLVWLARRLAHPQPATTVPPYSVSAYDVRTGAAETVVKQYVDANVGPGALPERRVPGLTVVATAGRGGTHTAQGRWQPVLDLCVGIARRGGFGLRCTGLDFDIYVPVNRATDGVEFSLERGNLAAFRYQLASPDATFVYAGGSGTGTSRTIVEGQDSAAALGWGRAERFIDRRDTSTTTDIAGSITEELTTAAATSSLVATPIDTPTCTYGVHYELGDDVGVRLDDGTLVVETITELTVSLLGSGVKVTPVVGEASLLPGTLTLLKRLADVESDVADLQRYY